MEENIQTMEQMEQTSTDSFLDGWDDVDSVVVEADQPAAEQHEAEAEEEAAPEATEQAEAEADASVEHNDTPAQEEATKVWNLRYMDNDKVVNEQEMVTLAQKGLDYDRIRTKYDESKPVMELFTQFAKKSGMDVPAYVAYLRTQAKKADGMSEAEAQRTVELEDREAAVAAREEARAEREAAERQAEQAKASAEARRQADIEEFTKTFPDVAKDPKAIPASVWNDVKGGMSLVAAYARYAVAKAQSDAAAQVAVSVKNENNAARATGSMKSAGNDTKTRDPFLEGWDS
jgi:hypothetical protein